jgi:transposase-like protein
MRDLPRSLPEFAAWFPDDEACARWLMAKRWPDGFRCPACGHDRAWELSRGVLVLQCAACERQVSVTAGTVMHGSHLPLRTWFLAAWLMTTHKNGISARQLWLQLGLGSYKSAWLLCAKLRRAMVNPEREPLGGLVEVDETTIPFRRQDDPIVAKPGRANEGKLRIAGAVEITGQAPGRARLAVIPDYAAETLGGFVGAHIATGSTVVSDGWPGYAKLKDVKHDPKVVGAMAAHVVLPWVHRVFANAKRWALGVYHGLRKKHLQRYLAEFVFRFNRRRTPTAAFGRLLGLSLILPPATYQMLISRS